MKFFKFLKNVKNRRLVIPALVVIFVVIFGGTIFGLAKTGKLKTFADTVVKTTQQLAPKAIGQNSVVQFDAYNSATSANGVGPNIAIRNSRDQYTWAVTNQLSQATYTVTNLTTTTTIGFYMDGTNCPPLVINVVPGQTYYHTPIYLYCSGGGGGDTEGTFSLDGHVVDQSTHQFISGATAVLTNGQYGTTGADGKYLIQNIPYTNSNASSIPSWQITASAPGYKSKTTTLGLLGVTSANVIQYHAAHALAMTLEKDLPEYKFTGSVLKDDNGSAFDQVLVELVDKKLTSNQVIATERSRTAGTYNNGKNYLIPDNSPAITRANLTELWLRFSPPSGSGYSSTEIRLTDENVITNTTIVGSGSSIYELKTIRDVRLAKLAHNVYFKVSIDDATCNPQTCPNRNSAKMVDGIPVVIEGQSGVERSSNSFTPNTVSGKFTNIAGSHRVYVNAASNGGNQAYLPPLPDPLIWDDSTSHITDVAGLGRVYLLDIKLRKNPAYVPQTNEFELQGLVTNPSNTNTYHLEESEVLVFCEGDSDCNLFRAAKKQNSTKTQALDNGSNHNYRFTGLYNIARPDSKIEKLTMQINKVGYYFDKNNNSTKDENENNTEEIKQSDIVVVGGKSVCKKDFILRSINDSDVRVSGTVKTKSGRALVSTVKLIPIKANGEFDEAGSIIFQPRTNSIDGKYNSGSLKGRVDLAKEYMLVAIPDPVVINGRNVIYSAEMVSIRFGLSPVQIINFLLEENTGSQITIMGYVQNIDATGQASGIAGAEVSAAHPATLGSWFQVVPIGPSVFTDAQTYQYKLQLDETAVFGDAPNGTTKTIVLTGHNGPSKTASKHKGYRITLTRGQGVLIRRDFQFFAGDPNDPAITTRNVTITLTQQEKKYRPISTGSPVLEGKSAPRPLSNVNVQLQSLRSPSSPDQSGYVITSEEIPTDSKTGSATFNGWRKEASIIIVNGVPQGLIPEGGDSVYSLSATAPGKTINYYKLPWDVNALKNADDLVSMQQGTEPWASKYVSDPEFENTIAGAGCCLTAMSNAVKFYYPNDKFDGVGMNPSVLFNLTGGRRLMMMNNFPALAELLRAKYGTTIRVTDTDWDQVDSLLAAGIPVLVHSGSRESAGIHNPIAGNTHGGHCFMLMATNGRGLYKASSSADSPPIYWVSKAQMGSINRIQKVTSEVSRTYFRGVSGRASSGGVAYAADANAHARTDRDYSVSAEIGSDSVAQIQKVFVAVKRPNAPDLYMEMNKSGQNFSYTIPKHVIVDDFSYKFVAINTFGAQISSEDYNVIVDHIASTPNVYISRMYSYLKFNVKFLRNNSSYNATQVQTYINNVYQNFRTAFARFLSWSNIRQSDLVVISGTVKNASGQLMPNLIVKIWEDAALSSDGRFTINNVKKGWVPVEVTDQTTGRWYRTVSPSVNVTAPNLNMTIVVDDPNDTGRVEASVFWRSTTDAQRTDGNTLKSGKIALIRNGRVDRQFDLAATGGKVSGVVQVGTFTAKYYMPDGQEKDVVLLGGSGVISSFSVTRGNTTNLTILPNDGGTFSFHITSQNGAADCNVWWWGHFYLTGPDGRRTDWYRTPANCSIGYWNGTPGRYYFQMTDNYGYNRVINPAYVDVPAGVVDATYEIKL